MKTLTLIITSFLTVSALLTSGQSATNSPSAVQPLSASYFKECTPKAKEMYEKISLTTILDPYKLIINANNEYLLSKSGQVVAKNNLINIQEASIVRYYSHIINNNLYIYYQALSGEDGDISKLVNIDIKINKILWQTAVGGVNIGEPVIFNDNIYLTAMGTVAKISLKSGEKIWIHDNLYEDGNANSFGRIVQSKDDIVFTDDNNRKIAVNDMDGKYKIIVGSSAISKNIKVYNGDYTLSEINAVGTAKYSFYEDENYQRVYHGDFTLSVGKGNFSCVIIGKFKNDMRDGAWTVKGNFGYPQNFDFLITENYINGQPNGIWTATSKRGEKIIEFDKRVLSNGLFIDTWELSSIEQKIQMKLKLDKNGFFIESDIINQGKTQNISKFIAGYEVLTVTKDVQTGESNVKRVDNENIIENLTRIERYLKNDPDSLLDIPYKLKTNSGIDEMGNYVDISYLLNFTKDVRGAVMYNGHQFYGLYHTELTEQKTREQIRIEEEKKVASQKAEEEKRIAAQKLAEEKRLLEEKKKRLSDEASKIIDISTFDNNLYQSILSDLNSNCRLFLSNIVKDKYISPLSFTFTPSFTWTPKEIIGSRYENAKNVTPYLYYHTNYSIDKASVPESFTKIFEIDKLANIEKEFEGEKFKMTVSAKYKEIKIEYITSIVSIKLNKEKEITWVTEIPENDKKIIEGQIKQLEKGKYSLNYRIGLFNENVVESTIEQIVN
jgi:hypothetical protein